jgi:HK97 gp10 family phage protein
MGFTNRDRLRRRMKSIPKAVRQALKVQNAKNAAELVETIRGFAPGDGPLQASVKNHDVTDSTRISQRIEAGGEATTKPVRDGQSATYDYALAQEFGTVNMPAHPFFWPAWRLKRRRFKSRMTRAAKKAIAGAVR